MNRVLVTAHRGRPLLHFYLAHGLCKETPGIKLLSFWSACMVILYVKPFDENELMIFNRFVEITCVCVVINFFYWLQIQKLVHDKGLSTALLYKSTLLLVLCHWVPNNYFTNSLLNSWCHWTGTHIGRHLVPPVLLQFHLFYALFPTHTESHYLQASGAKEKFSNCV